MTDSPQVRLEVFEGPLDLLLHLIRKNDLSITDIPISQITTEYLAYLDLLKDLKLDVAGDYLVMAATLMQIKAHMLLPAPPPEAAEEDPRAELIDRLLEYQRYKEAARQLEGRLRLSKDVHYRAGALIGEDDYQLKTSLFDLLDAFRHVLKGLNPDVRDIFYEEVPLEVKIREILSFLETHPRTTFREMLGRESTRRGLIGAFLALLELVRMHQIRVVQSQVFGEIFVERSLEEVAG